MSERIYEALEVCLSAMQTGVTAQQCQAIYPDLVDAIAPAVEGAQAARTLTAPYVPVAAQRRSCSRLWVEAAGLERQPARIDWLRRSFSPLRLVLLLALLLAAVSLDGLAAASAQSLPGDALYPVKRAAERVTLQLVPAPQIRYQAEMAYIQRRIDEVHELARAGRVGPVSFEGTLVRQTGDTWIVADVPVQIDAYTRFSGEMSPGALVEIEGIIQSDGHVLAEEVHVRSFQYSGPVISMSRTSWNVNGTYFHVLVDTQIDSSVQVGDWVLVLARSEDDNTFYASAITYLSNRVVQQASKTSQPAIRLEWRDTVRSMSGDAWLVGTRTVMLTAQTVVKGAIQVGDPVVVRGWLQPDGSLLAEDISLLDPSMPQPKDYQKSVEDSTSGEMILNGEDPQDSQQQEDQSVDFEPEDSHKSAEVKGGSEVQQEQKSNEPHESSFSKDDSTHQDQPDNEPAEQTGDD